MSVDKNEIKKDLYKSKENAKLLYYEPANGDLIYQVFALGKNYTFPIHTVEKTRFKAEFIEQEQGASIYVDTIKLTDDLKGARFEPEIKGSTLIRWIQQAIEADEFH
jgi:hypothetical protein